MKIPASAIADSEASRSSIEVQLFPAVHPSLSDMENMALILQEKKKLELAEVPLPRPGVNGS